MSHTHVSLAEQPVTQISCQGLLLDMDGVLVDSTPAVARVWTRWAIKHHLDPVQAVQLAHGRPSLSSIQELLPNAEPAVHQSENRWMEQAEIEDVEDVVALPGTKELLAAIRPSQFAVVTSATRALTEVRLRAASLWQYTQNLITASDIRHGKPDPEPYRKGAAALNLPPQSCIVIEDAASGTRSGKAAGSRVLAVRTTSPDEVLLAAGADWIVNDCSSLRVLSNSPSRQVTLALADNQLPRVPKMQ
jgi:mannitol-1-/sugar-/sorbitol-6-phosphatase